MEWTGARYADRPSVEASTHVAAPPGAVWALVSDPLVMPRLSDELQSVEWLDGATGPAVGARFRGHNAHPSFGEWSTDSVIVDCEAPRVFCWSVGGLGTDSAAEWRFTLEPDGSGTVLTQWMRMGPARSGLSVAIDAMPDKEQKIVFVRLREFEAAMTGNLARIKHDLESTAAAT